GRWESGSSLTPPRPSPPSTPPSDAAWKAARGSARGGKRRPGKRIQIAQYRFLPTELGVGLEPGGRVEVHAASMTRGRGERQVRGHGGVHRFILYRARINVRGVAARREVLVAAQSALTGLGAVQERIVVIGLELLRRRDVDLP